MKGIKPILRAFKISPKQLNRQILVHLLLEKKNTYEGGSEFQMRSEDLHIKKEKVHLFYLIY